MSSVDRVFTPVTDPYAQYLELRTDLDAAINRVLQSGNYILGPECELFETEFAQFMGAKFAVGVGNGTDALALALRALGIGVGDEVITVSHTAVATVAAIEQVGATPVLVDVQPEFLTLDPELLPAALSERTRAVIPVHIYGQAADMASIQSFCQKHSLALVEDVSQAHGATWNGKRLGTFGVISAFSCYPTKNLGALGDAGILLTSDPAIADRLRRLRQYGWKERNMSTEPGINSRLDELQAAILRAKLPHLDRNNERRRQIAYRYSNAFRALEISVPPLRGESQHAFHLYVAQVNDRDNFRHNLHQNGITTGIHYPTPVHRQPAYAGRIRLATHMKVTDAAAERIVSLPMFPELSDESVKQVIEATLSIL
jgi:dTDP-4-amino-4,6-dideoxygalactose transaminase